METPRKILTNKQLENVSNFTTPIKIPPTPLLKTLGFGTGINVFKFNRSPLQGKERSPWAIKRVSKLAKERGQFIFNLRLKSEAEILRKLSHPNIIGFRAIITAKDGSDSLAIECCNTCLGTILEERLENNLGPLPVNFTMKMISDVLNALDYLHNEVYLLHGDLKSFNILVAEEFKICKLCDFGVSIQLNNNQEIDIDANPDMEYIGTESWSAPEVIEGQTIISSKADIFSFGLVIYETIALMPPHSLNIIEDEDKNEDDLSFACGTRPPFPESFELFEEYQQIISIYYVCTNYEPDNRPSAKSLLKSLLQTNKLLSNKTK